MEKTEGISRARFLGGAVAAGAAAALGPAGDARAARGRRGLRHRGVVYTVGEGETPATAWNAHRMRTDIRAVRRDLHADTVDVTGDGVERLQATAREAAEQGLHIWLQPTPADLPQRDILDHLAETGRFAQRLRRQGASVDLSVGCEFQLFVPGIVPGDTVLDRVRALLTGAYDPVVTQRRLEAFTARAARTARSVFDGRLGYAAAEDDRVDWSLFDVVGIDYYSVHRRPADHVRALRRHLRRGKPLAVTEFGTCAYRGAPEAGGMAWDVVDLDKRPPEIKGHLVRSERTQADHLVSLLRVFESMGLYAAMAYEFVTPDAPHRADDPRHDLDLASYALTRTVQDRPGDPRSDWHWEPKQAFHALARHYAAAARGHRRPATDSRT
ncbi:abortive phage infection protein [Streptomyces sp. DSM 15324]|uniref:abortive phage infection protein n=1 Tax=Streptomyces sp. DSM 15324 TaxID=1739111 RepID=UPI000747CB75|nr:abortive phage infection protein [Streptomyces sp. DSM 15324]KUO09620.1 abortive phage infection protein [Streptomyces sp. DSM 15324]